MKNLELFDRMRQLAVYSVGRDFYVEIIDEGCTYGAYIGSRIKPEKEYIFGIDKYGDYEMSLEEFVSTVDSAVPHFVEYYRQKYLENPFQKETSGFENGQAYISKDGQNLF